METADRKMSRKALSDGSALILTVVLTSLLAIVGVLFVMVSRVDKMATSSISENKELDLAADTVVAKISRELTLDVPGVAGQEYYDYPGVNDTWMQSIDGRSRPCAMGLTLSIRAGAFLMSLIPFSVRFIRIT